MSSPLPCVGCFVARRSGWQCSAQLPLQSREKATPVVLLFASPLPSRTVADFSAPHSQCPSCPSAADWPASGPRLRPGHDGLGPRLPPWRSRPRPHCRLLTCGRHPENRDLVVPGREARAHLVDHTGPLLAGSRGICRGPANGRPGIREERLFPTCLLTRFENSQGLVDGVDLGIEDLLVVT